MKLFVLILTFSIPIKLSHETRSAVVIWNVGQGQWTTWISPRGCFHFDIGGEKLVSEKYLWPCVRRPNVVFLSHWDWDHIGLAKKARRILPNLCIANPPVGPVPRTKKRYLSRFPTCSTHATADSSIVELFSETQKLVRAQKVSANELSRVFLVTKKFLIPGDATEKAERQWSFENLRSFPTTHLLLGHHGSKTSTSQFLLQKLKTLRQAVASARFKRYGHPHASVRLRLKKKGISLITTEQWGHLYFWFPD